MLFTYTTGVNANAKVRSRYCLIRKCRRISAKNKKAIQLKMAVRPFEKRGLVLAGVRAVRYS
jgi:hypothetical protein